jgi:aspartyl-tRNA(Asn)/glutamyl-tRNA(Gln) amidotransferase subunit A
MQPTIKDTVQQIEIGAIKPSDLVRDALTQEKSNRSLNIFAFLDEAGATEEAERCTDEALRGKFRGRLHGIPITIKDLYNVKNMPTRGGIKAALPPIEPDEATAVRRLREAGAIFLGKTNMHEIAFGITGENPWTGDVKNPHDPARQAGGSSSGSAVAVAARIGFASLGSDTAGSVRIPSALCGVVGFKPSTGLIPLEGALPLSITCDHAGPITRCVSDAHLLTEILADRSLPLRPLEKISPKRFGVPRKFLEGWLGRDVCITFDSLLDHVQKTGVELIDIDFDKLDTCRDAFDAIRAPEASYTHRVAIQNEPQNFSDINRPRLLDGFKVTATDYLAGLDFRKHMQRELDEVLCQVDAMLLPTTPLPAQLRGASDVEIDRGTTPLRTAFIRLTLPFAFTGHPVLSLPFAWINGLPLGVQIVAPLGEDARVLEIGMWLERQMSR